MWNHSYSFFARELKGSINNFLITFFLCLLAHTSPCWGDARLEVTVDPRVITVGDPVTVTFRAQLPPGLVLKKPDLAKEWGPFEILDAREHPLKEEKNSVLQEFQYKITSFDVGISTLPALSLTAELANGTTQEIRTPEMPILVKSLLTAKTKDIRNIKGPLTNRWKWLLAMLALGALGGAYHWWQKKKASLLTPAVPAKPAHELALEALESLEQDLMGPANLFYSRLTDIFRLYLENRYRMNALDRTTSELVLEMKKKSFSSSELITLRELLELSDLAKFARFEPDEVERQRDLARVKDFVIRTKQEKADHP